MFIEPINQDKIKVTVNEEEQREYGITYESMNYSDCNTRKLCEDIMEKAHSEIGFTVGNSKLLVEAKLSANGSVTLYLSKINTPKTEEKDELFGQVIKFDTSNALIDGIPNFLPYREKLCLSNLYFDEGAYYIYFEILCTHSEAKNLLHDMLEFSSRTKKTKAYLDEHAELISEQTAIDEMCVGRKYTSLNL